MPELEIRTAVESDREQLRRIYRDASWSNEGDRPLYALHPEFLDWPADGIADGRTRAALVAGRAVGFASLVERDGDLELEDLFVDPASMRRGIGRALIRDAEVQARRRGVDRIHVDANDHALAFYEDVGFVVLERIALEHGTAVRMVLGRHR